MVYLDNSATTQPCQTAMEEMRIALAENWGNPSSLYLHGIRAEQAVSHARQMAADLLRCAPGEILFTSGGTESNNTALLCLLNRRHVGRRVIVSSFEHPSVLETVKRLETAGFEICLLKPGADGFLDLTRLEALTDENTALVSMMLVNNEIGCVQPVKEACRIVKQKAPSALFHCDAVQAFGKLPISAHSLGVDFLSASAHKLHGPKGIGLLYVKKGVRLSPLLSGGGQESGLRSGTESVPLICGFAGALRELPPPEQSLAPMRELYAYAKEAVLAVPGVEINNPHNDFPYILNLSLCGYRSETVLHFLDSLGICVSSGSACSKGKLSPVLKEIGLDAGRIDSSLRVSFGRYNTKQDIDLLCRGLKQATATLRKA